MVTLAKAIMAALLSDAAVEWYREGWPVWSDVTRLVREVEMYHYVRLSEAKARLSEVVRAVRNGGEEVIITVDGEPAARLVPVDSAPKALTAAERASVRALMAALARFERPGDPFDAVDVIGEGRR